MVPSAVLAISATVSRTITPGERGKKITFSPNQKRQRGASIRAIAKQLGVGAGTVTRTHKGL